MVSANIEKTSRLVVLYGSDNLRVLIVRLSSTPRLCSINSLFVVGLSVVRASNSYMCFVSDNPILSVICCVSESYPNFTNQYGFNIGLFKTTMLELKIDV